MKKEIEVKIKIEGKIKKIQEKLLGLKGISKHPYRQVTYGFFSKDSIKRGIFPRIRNENGKSVLTIKVKPKKQSRYFERREYSMEIDNIKNGIKILELLGYDKIRKFSKTRQEWILGKTKINIDRLYFGNFLEIEGSKKDITRTIKILKLEKEPMINKSYLGLEKDLCGT